jgi:MerR family transcriptional regulator/heat shock protein HspR
VEQIAERCGVEQTFVRVLLEHGVIHVERREPLLMSQEVTLRINKVVRLQRDLGVNVPGVSVILELLERIDELERQVPRRRR